MPQLYTLEGSIAEFFEEHSTDTKDICDSIARTLIGDPVLPVPIQGAWSYTVTAGEAQTKIVQCRAQGSVLSMPIHDLARQIHDEFVPSLEYHGDTGGVKPLAIYTIDKVPGIPHVIANSDSKASDLRLNTVRDFARFFAQSWNSHRSVFNFELGSLKTELERKLGILLGALPVRFHQTITILREQYIPLLFEEDFPTVLAHGDLCGLNILVDPESLHVTGFIDWAEATLAPFGLALYGMCNILGVMNSTGWHYHTNYQDMVAQFWTTFEHHTGPLSDTKKNTIRAACTVGILLHHGFAWNGIDKSSPATEEDDCMKYLDSWLGAESRRNDLLSLA